VSCAGFCSVSAETSCSAVKISAVSFCVVSFVECVGKGEGKDHPIAITQLKKRSKIE
jgi:hypothetical protein